MLRLRGYMPPAGQEKLASTTPSCRGNAGRPCKRSSVVLRVFLAPAEAYGACFAPRRAAQGGARLTLPGSWSEPNGGAPGARCIDGGLSEPKWRCPPVRDASTGGLLLSPMAVPPGAQCNDGGSLLSRVCLLFWGEHLGYGKSMPGAGGAGWQWGIAATWQLLLGSCQGVGRRLCP